MLKVGRTRLAVLAVSAILAVAAFGCGQPDQDPDPGNGQAQDPAPQAVLLDIRGSDTMVNLGAALAEAYMADNAHAELVVQGGGSGTGLAALLNRNADIAQASRPMRDTEWAEATRLGIAVEEIIIGYDAIVVCVHPDNPVTQLTIAQLGAIYRGEIGNWSEVGGVDESIVLLSRDTTSGTFGVFRDLVVREGGIHPDAEYGPDAMMNPSTQFIVDETRRNSRAIGYIGLGYLDDTLQAIGILVEGSDLPVIPGQPHPAGLAYPLSRPLFFYVSGDSPAGTSDYLDFVLSPAGQQVVSDLFFLPR